MGKKKKKSTPDNVAARNRKARYNYHILEEWEVGICLLGSEVKSLRTGKANIQDSFAEIQDNEVYLLNAYIPEYNKSGQFNHETRRPRKLLLKRKEIKKLTGKLKEKGLTAVPLSIYFNRRGIAKVKLALAQGKANYDKRETIKKRDWERQKARLLREK